MFFLIRVSKPDSTYQSHKVYTVVARLRYASACHQLGRVEH